MAKPACFDVSQPTAKQIRALKACWAGTADTYQQRLALKLIVSNFSRAQDVLFIPGSPDQTAFLNGRGFVGAQILKHLNQSVGALTDDEDNTHG